MRTTLFVILFLFVPFQNIGDMVGAMIQYGVLALLAASVPALLARDESTRNIIKTALAGTIGGALAGRIMELRHLEPATIEFSVVMVSACIKLALKLIQKHFNKANGSV